MPLVMENPLNPYNISISKLVFYDVGVKTINKFAPIPIVP